MILVMDTDVVVAGFRSPTGASAALLQLARQGAFRIAVSNALLVEYEAVLTRPEHLKQDDRTESDA
jgi:predicted nucleic acid-binding protein